MRSSGLKPGDGSAHHCCESHAEEQDACRHEAECELCPEACPTPSAHAARSVVQNISLIVRQSVNGA
jgi:hypothetical protein